MTEQDIIRVLSERRPVGTEDFRDALLARCLAAIDAIDADEDSADPTDEELGMLAAAGGLPATIIAEGAAIIGGLQ